MRRERILRMRVEWSIFSCYINMKMAFRVRHLWMSGPRHLHPMLLFHVQPTLIMADCTVPDYARIFPMRQCVQCNTPLQPALYDKEYIVMYQCMPCECRYLFPKPEVVEHWRRAVMEAHHTLLDQEEYQDMDQDHVFEDLVRHLMLPVL